MEKYLRLLNPKTVNYQSVRVDHMTAGISAQDVLLAMSYAHLTPLQENLIRLKYLNANSLANIEMLARALQPYYKTQFEQLNPDYHFAVLRVALIEFCAVPADYKPSFRSRAAFSGYSHVTVKNHLAKFIDYLIDNFEDLCRISEIKIITQIKNKT